MGWKWAPIGGLKYRTHVKAPKYDVQYAVAVVAVAGHGKLKNVR